MMAVNKRRIKQIVLSKIKDASSDLLEKVNKESALIKEIYPDWETIDKTYEDFANAIVDALNNPKLSELEDSNPEFEKRMNAMRGMMDELGKIDQAFEWLRMRSGKV